MAYVIVVGAALVVGAAVYVSAARRSTQSDTGPFDPPPAGGVAGSVQAPDVTYVPVGSAGPVSWQTRSISLLALVALIMVCASAIGVALYKVGAILVRVVIHKIQTS
jgi:hypothetical protein